jgi:hypothetical protein
MFLQMLADLSAIDHNALLPIGMKVTRQRGSQQDGSHKTYG